MKKLIFLSLIIPALFVACENQDWEFPDYKYTTVYFPYQAPIRTIVLGEDIYDNSLDNAYKCRIMATMGGVYENNTDRILDIEVDNSIIPNNLVFNGDSGKYIQVMPSGYYSLASSKQIVIPSGSVAGGIEVQLTDAFFADPLAVTNTYVIPVRIKSVKNADSILSGKALVTGANLFIPAEWSIEPKNYTLFCIKYVNPWHGSYLRRGVDVGTGNNGNTALDTLMVYRNKYVERDQVIKMQTISLSEVSVSLKTRDKGNTTDIPFEIRVKIDNSGNCVVTAPENAAYTATGNGKFVKKGDSWGNEPRDVMYLKYELDFGNSTHNITDTMVIRDRGVKFETFTPVIYN